MTLSPEQTAEFVEWLKAATNDEVEKEVRQGEKAMAWAKKRGYWTAATYEQLVKLAVAELHRRTHP